MNIYYILGKSPKLERAITLIKDICNLHSIHTLKSLNKNFSIDDRMPMTTTHQSLYKKKKTFINGGIDLINSKNNNKPEKTLSIDSLEVLYKQL